MAFRREKFVPRGGPSGGDGGRGGSIFLQADPMLWTLLDVSYKRIYEAPAGKHGEGSSRHGKSGEDLVILVPLGTLIFSKEGNLLADLSQPGELFLLAKGGKGGRGNASFATSVKRSPRFAEKGERGEEVEVDLELRLLADVGIVGPPNAGKSTLISALSSATPKIADYPFTTLTPVLGVLNFSDLTKAILAEIPGLVEGAHAGAGLGQEFLRHVMRTRALLFLLDLSTDPLRDIAVLKKELSAYEPSLSRKPYLIVLNKEDLVDEQVKTDFIQALHAAGEKAICSISASEKSGLERLKEELKKMLIEAPPAEPATVKKRVLYTLRPEEDRSFNVQKLEKGQFLVKGAYLEKLVERTDLDNDEALQRLQKQLDRLGVEQALRKAGIKEGDSVRVGEAEFIYRESGVEE